MAAPIKCKFKFPTEQKTRYHARPLYTVKVMSIHYFFFSFSCVTKKVFSSNNVKCLLVVLCKDPNLGKLFSSDKKGEEMRDDIALGSSPSVSLKVILFISTQSPEDPDALIRNP